MQLCTFLNELRRKTTERIMNEVANVIDGVNMEMKKKVRTDRITNNWKIIAVKLANIIIQLHFFSQLLYVYTPFFLYHFLLPHVVVHKNETFLVFHTKTKKDTLYWFTMKSLYFNKLIFLQINFKVLPKTCVIIIFSYH